MLSEHSNENQNSRDVSAFSFAGNPLSEEALKAKAEFETCTLVNDVTPIFYKNRLMCYRKF